MTMLKTTQSYVSDAGAQRQRYAEHHDRALVVRCGPLVDDPGRWGEEFDTIREIWGKNWYGGKGSRGPRKVYDFIISPDPRDHARPDALADMAEEWVRERYPDHQWAVVVHDDGTHGVVHAHVYVNSVRMADGRMIHLGREDLARDTELVQQLSAERGWSTMGNSNNDGDGQSPTPHVDARRLGERRMEARGGVTWKGRMRAAVDEAVGEARSWTDFLVRVERAGYVPRVTRRGITFYPSRGVEGRPCKGASLDDGTGRYTLEGISRRIVGDVAGAVRLLGREGRVVPLRRHDVVLWRRWREADVPRDPVERERLRLRLLGYDEGSRAQNALDWMHVHGIWSFAGLRAREAALARGIEEAEARLAGLRDIYDGVREAARLAREACEIRDDMARGRGLASDPARLAELEVEIARRGYARDVTAHEVWSSSNGVKERVQVAADDVAQAKAELEEARAVGSALDDAPCLLARPAPSRSHAREVEASRSASRAFAARARRARTAHGGKTLREVPWEEVIGSRYDELMRDVRAFEAGGHKTWLSREASRQAEALLATMRRARVRRDTEARGTGTAITRVVVGRTEAGASRAGAVGDDATRPSRRAGMRRHR